MEIEIIMEKMLIEHRDHYAMFCFCPWLKMPTFWSLHSDYIHSLIIINFISIVLIKTKLQSALQSMHKEQLLSSFKWLKLSLIMLVVDTELCRWLLHKVVCPKITACSLNHVTYGVCNCGRAASASKQLSQSARFFCGLVESTDPAYYFMSLFIKPVDK